MVKAQVSTELLITIAFAVAVILPVIFLVYLQVSNSSQQIAIAQAENTAKRIKNAIDIVGAMGPPAKMNLLISVPQNTEKIIIGQEASGGSSITSGREVVIRVLTPSGKSDVVALTLVPTKWADSTYAERFSKSGTYHLTIEAMDDAGTCGASTPRCVVVYPPFG
ncbi:MAG: hypothetical protein QXP42_06060 [Candidatus Micrarchaeia archaeon]